MEVAPGNSGMLAKGTLRSAMRFSSKGNPASTSIAGGGVAMLTDERPEVILAKLGDIWSGICRRVRRIGVGVLAGDVGGAQRRAGLWGSTLAEGKDGRATAAAARMVLFARDEGNRTKVMMPHMSLHFESVR